MDFLGQEKYCQKAFREAAGLGTNLLKAANGWEEACRALRRCWIERQGDHFQQLHSTFFEGLVDEDLLARARSNALQGVSAQSENQGQERVRCTPHPSLRDHMDEAASQLWKDASKGRALICFDEGNELLQGVVSVPMARVPKMLPDRTISEKGRIIWDATPVNVTCHKSRHPPALQPKHAEVARTIVWWQQRYPGVPILLSKKDVSDAFKWIPIASKDSRLFAADLPGAPFGSDRPITIVYNSLTFGWCGAPGEYMLFAWVAKQALHSHRPQRPEWHGATPFQSFVLMDDTVLIEPLLGVRPWIASATAEECTRNTLGPATLNEEKDLIEGKFEVEKLIWGLNYNTAAGTRSLPPVKLEKASHLLHLQEFDHGNRLIPLKLMQELRGNQQFWLAVMPSLGPLLQATNDLLGPPDSNGYVVARGEPYEQDRVWHRFWEAVKLQRLLVDHRAVWEVRFTHPLLESLSLEEVMSIPNQKERIVWASGDATLDRVAGIDWDAGKAFSCEVEPLKGALTEFIRDASGEQGQPAAEEGSGFIISVTEMLAVVVLSSLRAASWKGRLVLYVGDNHNVIRWLAKRQAKHSVVTYLLQILAGLEASNSFRLHGAFVRTYHNVTADALTREDAEEVMRKKGLTMMPDAEKSLRVQLDRGWQRRALIWAGQDDADARQALRLSERRNNNCAVLPNPSSCNLLGFRVLDMSEGMARYAQEGMLLGGQVIEGLEELDSNSTLPLGYFQTLESITQESIRSLSRGVARARPKVVWVDVRTEESGKRVAKALKALGLDVRTLQVSGRTLGDQSWWKRWVIIGSCEQITELPCIDASLEPSTPIPKFFPEWYVSPADEELVEGVVQLEPTMPFLGALTPKPCGTFVTVPPKNERKILWGPKRPLPGFHPGSWDPNHKEPLLLYSGEKQGPKVKVISPEEVCFLLNGRFGPKDTGESSSLAAVSLVAAPRKLALLGLTWFGSEVPDPSRWEDPNDPETGTEARFAPGSPNWEKTVVPPPLGGAHRRSSQEVASTEAGTNTRRDESRRKTGSKYSGGSSVQSPVQVAEARGGHPKLPDLTRGMGPVARSPGTPPVPQSLRRHARVGGHPQLQRPFCGEARC